MTRGVRVARFSGDNVTAKTTFLSPQSAVISRGTVLIFLRLCLTLFTRTDEDGTALRNFGIRVEVLIMLVETQP